MAEQKVFSTGFTLGWNNHFNIRAGFPLEAKALCGLFVFDLIGWLTPHVNGLALAFNKPEGQVLK